MQALVVSEDLGSSGPAFTVWPKDIFEVDFEVIEQVGQGHFGKVYSVKRRKGNDTTYAAKFITCKGNSIWFPSIKDLSILIVTLHIKCSRR